MSQQQVGFMNRTKSVPEMGPCCPTGHSPCSLPFLPSSLDPLQNGQQGGEREGKGRGRELGIETGRGSERGGGRREGKREEGEYRNLKGKEGREGRGTQRCKY